MEKSAETPKQKPQAKTLAPTEIALKKKGRAKNPT